MSTPTDTYCGSARCGIPTVNTTICPDCDAQLEQHLAEIPALFDELRIATTKQARFTTSGARTGGTKSTPLMFNTAAADKTMHLTTTILNWQGRYADHLGQPIRYPNPITATAWMLTAHTLKGVTTYVDAGNMLDALHTVIRESEKIIDRPADRWFAGVCSIEQPNGTHCDYDLYAVAKDGNITCPSCGYRHDIADRRMKLLQHAENVLATATEAARAIVVWSDYERGENLLVKRIGAWADRKRITKAGVVIVGGKERPTYRIGDILDLLSADSTQQTG